MHRHTENERRVGERRKGREIQARVHVAPCSLLRELPLSLFGFVDEKKDARYIRVSQVRSAMAAMAAGGIYRHELRVYKYRPFTSEALSGRKVETLSDKVALKTSICH